MEKLLKGKVSQGSDDANFTASRKTRIELRTFRPLLVRGKFRKKARQSWNAGGYSVFKLNANVFSKPRKHDKPAKEETPKIQLLIGNKLRDLFRFKNLKDTAQAFNTSEANLNNLNSGKAGDGLCNAFRAVINFADTIPLRKRKKILANINFSQLFSNT